MTPYTQIPDSYLDRVLCFGLFFYSYITQALQAYFKKRVSTLQAFSVSAAKQAGVVMTNVAGRVEEDMTNLHDQILGGKRNLPDHAPGEQHCESES